MTAVLLAAMLAAAAAGCAVPGRPRVLLRRRMRLTSLPSQPRTRRWGLLAAAVAALAMTFVADRPHLMVLGLVGLAVTAAVVRLARRGRARKAQKARRSTAIDLCDALVAELRAGAPPVNALREAIAEWPELRTLGAVVGVGGDVPLALRSLAQQSGAGPLAHIAAGWEVAHRSGAGLADVLDRLSVSLRDDEDVRLEVDSALGPPRATAKLLAVLPAFGAVLGMGLGADPIGVLLGSMFGALCLAAGATLAIAGLFWVERIAATAEV